MSPSVNHIPLQTRRPAKYDRLLTSINIAFVWQSPQRLAQRSIIVASGALMGHRMYRRLSFWRWVTGVVFGLLMPDPSEGMSKGEGRSDLALVLAVDASGKH